MFYMSKIKFKKFRINKKYRIKFKKSYIILFLQKEFVCPEFGENRALQKTHLYLLFQNCFLTQTKFLNSSSRSEENHKSFGNF